MPGKLSSIPKEFLEQELQTSLENLDHLKSTVDRILDKNKSGKTDKGNTFSTVWRGTVAKVRSAIGRVSASGVLTNAELAIICREVNEAINVLRNEFNLQASKGATKKLMRETRNELRRVQRLIGAGYELEDEGLQDEEEEDLEEEEMEDEGGGDLLLGAETIGESVDYFELTLKSHLDEMFVAFMKALRRNAGFDIRRQELSVEQFSTLGKFLRSLEILLNGFVNTARQKLRAGENWDFETFREEVIESLQEAKPSHDPEAYGDIYPEDAVARCIEEYFGRMIQKIQAMGSASQFYSIASKSDKLSSENFAADKIFLAKKKIFMQERAEFREADLEYDEEYPVSEEEVQLLKKLWLERRADVEDVLDSGKREEMAKIVNDSLHGGLSLRDAGDLERILDLWREDEIEKGREKVDALRHKKAVVSNVLEYLKDQYILELIMTVLSLVRGDLEKKQQAETGEVVAFSKARFEKLMSFLGDIAANIELNFASYNENGNMDLPELRNLFVAKGGKAVGDRDLVENYVEVQLRKHIALSPEEIQQHLRKVNYLTHVIPDVCPAEEGYEPLVGDTYDVPSLAKQWILGSLLKEGGEAYEGPVMEVEENYLTSACELMIDLSADKGVDEVMIDLEEDLAAVTQGLNDQYYCGVKVRSEDKVREFLREIVIELALKKRSEERQSAEISEELQRRIDEAVAWVNSLPGSTTRFFRRWLLAMAEQLQPHRLKIEGRLCIPVFQIRDIVEKIELCMERSAVDDRSGRTATVRNNLSEMDVARLVSVPVVESGSWSVIDRISVRLDDLQRRIERIDEAIQQKRQKQEARDELNVRKEALVAQKNGLELAIAGATATIRIHNERILTIRRQALETTDDGEPNAEQQAEIEHEKADKERLRLEAEENQGRLEDVVRELLEIDPRIEALDLESQGIAKLVDRLNELSASRDEILRALEVINGKELDHLED